MPAETERLDGHRSQVRTRSGPASYIDTGGPGRPALFVHGLATGSYLWRHVIEQLDGQYRCAAADLPRAAAGTATLIPGLSQQQNGAGRLGANSAHLPEATRYPVCRMADPTTFIRSRSWRS